MTQLVVDSSCGLKWCVPEADSAHAETIRDAFAGGAVDLIAPDLYVAEVTNVIWKKCHLRGELTESEAHRALGLALFALPDLVPTAVLVEQALHLALIHRRPVYDCIYVALSLQLGCPLVTADDRLIRSMRPALGRVIGAEEAALSL